MWEPLTFLISHVGPLSAKSCTVTVVSGKLCTHYFTGPLIGQLEQWLISHAFLAIPVSYPYPWEGPSELPWGLLGGH